MFCNQCGAQIQDESRFCNFCGASQSAAAPPASGEATPTPAATRAMPLGKAVGIGAAALFGILLIAGVATEPPTEADNVTNAIGDNIAIAAATQPEAAAAAPEPAPATPWTYSSESDKVRGGETHFARTASTNQVYQPSPYDGGTSMSLTVRKHPEWGTDVILTISEGQMMCPSYEGCSGTVRFDDGPAQPVSFNGPEDSSSETVFVVGARSFIAKLKKARKLTIEKTLYQAGAPQFEFDVAGLEWSH
jgi:hypothetical protein